MVNDIEYSTLIGQFSPVGVFSSLGWSWMSEMWESLRNHEDMTVTVLNNIFPLMNSCKWRQFGSGGDIKTTHYLCILSVNRMSEKIFLLFWFWFMVLMIISICNIVYYAIMFFSKNVKWRDRFLAIAINETLVE